MRNTLSRISLLTLLWVLFLPTTFSQKADDEDVLNRIIQIPRSNGTVYSLLGKITDLSGYLFIYDSRLIDNDKKTRIKAGQYTIQEAIGTITGNKQLQMRIIGSHILLSSPEKVIVKTSPQPISLTSPDSSTTHITKN